MDVDFLTVGSLLDLDRTVAAPLFDGVKYPWQVLGGISDFIRKIGPTLDSNLFEQRGEDIWIARTAVIAPTAFIGGPCIIDDGAEIRHCAFIRGSAIIGKGSVVGNSTEVNNAVVFDCVQIPHYNYVGDSVLGYRSHLGAGAITSNVKSDKSDVCIRTDSQTVQTGLRKMGAVVGDFVEVGCNSVLCPGTVIGRGSTVYPLSMVRGYVRAGSIYKSRGEIVDKAGISD